MGPKKTRNESRKDNYRKLERERHSAVSKIPSELQQILLNVFEISFRDRLQVDVQPLLQEIKGHLFNRDFLTAFGQEDYLQAYAARWSPPRALGYLQVLVDLADHISFMSEDSKEEGHHRKIVCLGGGAGAEIVALGGFWRLCKQNETSNHKPCSLTIEAIDIAKWDVVVENLSRNLTTAPPLSAYASAAAQAENGPMVDSENFDVMFHQYDVLNTDFSTMKPLLKDAKLTTILFTLNELYSTSVSLTQKFLLNLTDCLSEGALLLVIDSPGSYSTVTLNGAEKKYPMQWLLDHTLLQQGSATGECSWEKVLEDESKWFRLLPNLRYPIELENMRFQMHLYKRQK